MKDNISKIKSVFIGCDPEFFLLNNKKPALVTALEVGIPGSKKEPFALSDGVFIHPDNVSLEVGMPAMEYGPNSKLRDYSKYFASKMEIVKKYLEEKTKGATSLWFGGHEYVFSIEQLTPEQNQVFGCDPSLNAYKGGEENPPIDVKRVGRRRFCGGHIHIGYDKSSVTIPDYALVILGEVMTSVLSLTVDNMGGERFSTYGRPGSYRAKPYGLEYRTPNNNWALQAIQKDSGSALIPEILASTILWVINNEQRAQELWDFLDPPNYLEYIEAFNPKYTMLREAYNTFMRDWLQENTSINLDSIYGVVTKKKQPRFVAIDIAQMQGRAAPVARIPDQAADVLRLREIERNEFLDAIVEDPFRGHRLF